LKLVGESSHPLHSDGGNLQYIQRSIGSGGLGQPMGREINSETYNNSIMAFSLRHVGLPSSHVSFVLFCMSWVGGGQLARSQAASVLGIMEVGLAIIASRIRRQESFCIGSVVYQRNELNDCFWVAGPRWREG